MAIRTASFCRTMLAPRLPQRRRRMLMAKARKGLSLTTRYRAVSFILNPMRRWKRVMSHVPLSAKDKARLIPELHSLCEELLATRRNHQLSARLATATRRYGGKGLSPFEQLIKARRAVARARKEIGDIQDDPLRNLAQFDYHTAMADSALRRFQDHLRDLGEPARLPDPWPPFVRSVASCLDKAGAPPTISGSNPTWFQKFMYQLQNQLLGKNGNPAKEKAFYSDIAKIMRGFRNQVARSGGNFPLAPT